MLYRMHGYPRSRVESRGRAYAGSAAIADAPAWFARAVKLGAPPGQSSTDPERSLSVSATVHIEVFRLVIQP